MSTEHPITPPPELVRQWSIEAEDEHQPTVAYSMVCLLAAKAAQWGADQELEACCEWLDVTTVDLSTGLRAARRPKLPRLKREALGALSRADKDALTNPLTGEVVALRTILSKEQSDTIRRALEALDD